MADQEREELFDAVKDTEDELLKGAFEPEQKEPEPEPQAEEPEAPKGERVRDEKGRFVAAQPEAQEAQQAQQAQQEPERPEDIVPSWRLREINEERRRVEAERDQLRADYARTQAMLAQIQKQQAPKPEPQLPDPVLDYPGFVKAMEDRLEARLATERQKAAADKLDMQLEMTHEKYGDRFEKAFEAIMIEGQRGNHQLVNQITSQRNPGEALMRWWTNNQVLAEVGGDPAAYKQKLREEFLNDPEYLAQAEQRLRDRAMGGGQRPNTVVKMPPSLSKATGTTEVPQTYTDGSEEAIFNYAMNSPKRR